VAVFSLAAAPPGAQLFENADKVLHAVAYAGTSFLFLLAAVWRPGRGEGRFPGAAPWIVLAASVTGLAIEIVQGHAGRQRSGLDFLADVIGVLVALGVWGAMKRRGRAPGPNGGVDPDPSEG
jgi:VanZ family protein